MILGYIIVLTCAIQGAIPRSALCHLGGGGSEIHFHTWAPRVQWREPPWDLVSGLIQIFRSFQPQPVYMYLITTPGIPGDFCFVGESNTFEAAEAPLGEIIGNFLGHVEGGGGVANFLREKLPQKHAFRNP